MCKGKHTVYRESVTILGFRHPLGIKGSTYCMWKSSEMKEQLQNNHQGKIKQFGGNLYDALEIKL